MNFDGVTYPRATLISPACYAPGNGSIPDALAGALTAAYFYERRANRLIGQQTYSQFLGDASAINLQTYFFAEPSFVDIARFTRYIPLHATHIACEVHFKSWAIRPTVALHRILVDATTTGEVSQVEVDAAFSGLRDFLRTANVQNLETREADLLERASHHVITVDMELTGAFTLGQEVEVVIQGRSVNKNGDGASYRPDNITAWWYSSG